MVASTQVGAPAPYAQGLDTSLALITEAQLMLERRLKMMLDFVVVLTRYHQNTLVSHLTYLLNNLLGKDV